MSIRHKLVLAFCLVALLAAGVAAYGFRLISSTSTLVVSLYDGPLMGVSYARSAQLDFAKARNLVEKSIMLREPATPAELTAIDAAMKQLAADIGVVKERMATATDFNDGVDKVWPKAQDWYAAGMAYLRAKGETQIPLPQVIAAKANAVTKALDSIAENASAYGFNFRADAETAATRSKQNLMTMGLAIVIAGLSLAVGMAASFSRPIRHAMAVSEEIASGNLSAQIQTKRKDELGRLLISLDKTRASLAHMEATKERDRAEQLAILRAEIEEERQRAVQTQNHAAEEQARVGREMADLISVIAAGLAALSQGDLSHRLHDGIADQYRQIAADFNAMAEHLEDTIGSIADAADEISGASALLSGSTADLSQRTEEQASNIEQTSASMKQISTTVKKNAGSAQNASQSAAATREVAVRGGEVVARAVEAMVRIEKSSRTIADIIGVIDEIARQTNLLALNAAVEAARAGDAGRGFAVVASEVRSLAQRSAQAAKDIKDLITNSNDQVQDGVDLVNKAGAALKEIVTSIKGFADTIVEIAAANAEQASGLDQVSKALAQMDNVTRQNSGLVGQNAAAAQTLEHQAAAMKERVAVFILGRAADPAVQFGAQRVSPRCVDVAAA